MSSPIDYLERTPDPSPAAAWAIGQADRSDEEQCLSQVFDRAVASGQDELGRQALMSLADFEDDMAERVLAAARSAHSETIRSAAEELALIDYAASFTKRPGESPTYLVGLTRKGRTDGHGMLELRSATLWLRGPSCRAFAGSSR